MDGEGLIHLVYRHGDVDDTAGRIYDRLVVRYGRERIVRNLFGAADELPPDPAAQAYLDQQMARVSAQVVVIGPRWLGGITRPRDLERAEVAAALRRQTPIIPVLAEGATMPAGAQLPDEIAQLTLFNAAQARLDPDFDADMQRLLATIERYTPGLTAQPAAPPSPVVGIPASTAAPGHVRRSGCSPWRVISIGLVTPALIFLLIAVVLSLTNSGAAPPSALAATPPATATFLPTPPAPGSYYSPLTNGAPDWLLGKQCKAEPDGLHIADSDNGCGAPTEADVADANFSVTVRQLSGATTWPYGLYFRAGGFGNRLYGFLIASAGAWTAFKDVDGTATTIASWRYTSAIRTGLGATNTIEVKFHASQLIFFINGQRVGALNDSSIPAVGTADELTDNMGTGLFGHSGIEVVFTNYRIQPFG